MLIYVYTIDELKKIYKSKLHTTKTREGNCVYYLNNSSGIIHDQDALDRPYLGKVVDAIYQVGVDGIKSYYLSNTFIPGWACKELEKDFFNF